MTPISLITDTLWRRTPEVLHSEVDKEYILMSIESNYYYGLDEVASRIWELLEQPRSASELCQMLTSEYDIDETTCQTETLELLQHLEQRNLVQQVSREQL